MATFSPPASPIWFTIWDQYVHQYVHRYGLAMPLNQLKPCTVGHLYCAEYKGHGLLFGHVTFDATTNDFGQWRMSLCMSFAFGTARWPRMTSVTCMLIQWHCDFYHGTWTCAHGNPALPFALAIIPQMYEYRIHTYLPSLVINTTCMCITVFSNLNTKLDQKNKRHIFVAVRFAFSLLVPCCNTNDTSIFSLL